MATTSSEPPWADVEAWSLAIHKYELEHGSKIVDKIKQNKTTKPEHLLGFIHDRRRRESRSKFSTLMSNISSHGQRFERFHAALDVLAQGIPFGCILWGSIRVVLEIVVGYAKAFERLLKALDMMGKRLPIIGIHAEGHNDSRLQGYLIDYYISMIRFWGKAIKFYARKRCFAFWRSVWSSYDIDFKGLEANMEANYGFVEQCSKALHESEAKVQGKAVQALVRYADDGQLSRIIDWLTPPGLEIDYYEQDLAMELNKRHENSCQWILRTPQYNTWASYPVDAHGKLFWISAAPGAGKTILSAFLIRHLSAVSGTRALPVLFVMFKAGHNEKRTALAAARTLTYQTLKCLNPKDQSLVEALIQRCNKSGSPQVRTFQSLWDLFCEHVVKLSSVTIVVDALDECKEGSTLAYSLWKLSQATQTKVLITSRREANLSSRMENCLSLNFGAQENDEDISRYLTTEISNSPKLTDPVVSRCLREHLKMDLSEYLLQSANGLFAWASLVLKELKSQITVKDILRTVDEIPSDLVDIYNVILRNIPTARRRLCVPILKWLAMAVRPLSVTEMWEILSTEIAGGYENFLVSEGEVEFACGSLVQVEDGILYLFHQSLADYLCNRAQEKRLDLILGEYSIDASKANLQIVNTCFAYMDASFVQSQITPDGEARRLFGDILKETYSFLDYAVHNWAHHLMNIDFLEQGNRMNLDTTFAWRNRWLYWIEVWFVLEAKGLWDLTQQIVTLRNWCDPWTLAEHKSQSSVMVVYKWAQHVSQLLEVYGSALEEDPSTVHFIDSASWRRSQCSSSQGSFQGREVIPSGLRAQHIILRSGPGEAYYTINIPSPPTPQKLEPPRYGQRLFALFHVDTLRSAIVMASYESTVPELLCQDLRTGLRMKPITCSPRAWRMDARYLFVGFSISTKGKYIATLYRSDKEGSRHDNASYELTVWTLSDWQDTSTPDLTEWCSIAFSMSLECQFLGECARPVVFDAEERLYCLSNCIDLKPGAGANLLSDRKLTQGFDVGALYDLSGFGYSSDGRFLLIHHGPSRRLLRLKTEDMSIDFESTLSASGAVICCVSHSGCYVVWCNVTSSKTLYIYDLARNESVPLAGSEYITFPASLNLNFSHNEDCLLGVMAPCAARNRGVSYLAIWNSLSNGIQSSCSDQLPKIIGVCFTELHETAYLATKEGWWSFDPSRLELLAERLRQPIRNSVVIRQQISKDGSQLALLVARPKSIQVELFRVPEKHPYHTNYLPLPPYVPNSGFRACFNGDLSLVAINDAIYGPADVSGRIKFTTLPIPTPEMSEKASDANRRGLARADLVPEFSACSEYILYTDSQRQRAGSLRVEIYHLTENGAFRVILPDGLSLEKPFHAQFVMHPVLPVLAVGSWTFSSKQARPEVALECWTLELDDPRSWLLVDRTELGFRDLMELEDEVASVESICYSECGTFVSLRDSSGFPVYQPWILPPYCLSRLAPQRKVQVLRPRTILHSTIWGGDAVFLTAYNEDGRFFLSIQDAETNTEIVLLDHVLPIYLADTIPAVVFDQLEPLQIRLVFLCTDRAPEIMVLPYTWAEMLERRMQSTPECLLPGTHQPVKNLAQLLKSKRTAIKQTSICSNSSYVQ